MSYNKIGVVYLCRAANDPKSFLDFADSYKKYRAECPHDLIIIFKGFQSGDPSLAAAKNIFKNLNYRPIEMADTGFDIGSYITASKHSNNQYLLFLNTHAKILVNGWLRLLSNAIESPLVGIAGATASYESIFSSTSLINKFTQLYINKKLASRSYNLEAYHGIIDYIQKNMPVKKKPKLHKLFDQVFRRKKQWSIFPQDAFSKEKIFPSFPNPHIRTNAFILSRELFLKCCCDCEISSKEEACMFESGNNSLSRKISKLGLKTLLVGANGKEYNVSEWPQSDTFRLGNQSNLIIADNQTENFKNLPEKEKKLFALISWGKSDGTIPTFNIRFQIPKSFDLVYYK